MKIIPKTTLFCSSLVAIVVTLSSWSSIAQENEISREHHIKIAIEHLHAAGLHDPAERLTQALRKHQSGKPPLPPPEARFLPKARPDNPPMPEDFMAPIEHQFGDLRLEIGRLHNELTAANLERERMQMQMEKLAMHFERMIARTDERIEELEEDLEEELEEALDHIWDDDDDDDDDDDEDEDEDEWDDDQREEDDDDRE